MTQTLPSGIHLIYFVHTLDERKSSKLKSLSPDQKLAKLEI